MYNLINSIIRRIKMKKLIAALLAALLLCACSGGSDENKDKPSGGAAPLADKGLTVTIEAQDAVVADGAAQASFDVYLKDVPAEGLAAIMFTVKAEGAQFTGVKSGPDMPNNFMPGETGKDTMSVFWADISTGIRADALAATFTVKLPEGMKTGDSVPVQVVLSDDPDNCFSFDKDPETGEEYVVTPAAKGAKITVAAPSVLPADSAAPGGDTDRSDETGRLDPTVETGSVEIKTPSGTVAPVRMDEEKEEFHMPDWLKNALIIAGAVIVSGGAVWFAVVMTKKKSKDDDSSGKKD